MSRNGRISIIILIILLGIAFIYLIWPKTEEIKPREVISTVSLPKVQLNTTVSVEQAIQKRRSIRRYTADPLSLQDVSQLMWAAQGITDPKTKFRTVPSGGHTFALEVYIIVGKGGVNGLDEGLYHYVPENHSLEKILNGDLREDFARLCNSQMWIKNAPVNIIISGNYGKMKNKYKDEELSKRFVNMEAGHAGQNIYLEAEARNLATVAIGSFYESQAGNFLHLPPNESLLYSYPVGHPATS